MIIFTIKLVRYIRTAIAGRKYPHQLAWAVAFGVLLGIVPHGNLLALATLIVVLSLRINHAMAAVTAIGTTFLASRFDPYSDRVGDYVLSHQKLGPMVADAWQWPLVPWTDLNNTVVMGSFLIGVGALIPIFMVTYPLFRVFAPSTETPDDSPAAEAVTDSKPFVIFDRSHDATATTHLVDHPSAVKATLPVSVTDSTTAETPQQASVDRYLASISEQETSQGDDAEATDESEHRVSVQTRIDVIRMKDSRVVGAAVDTAESKSKDRVDVNDNVCTTEKPLDEALNYLLRQLRDSQQRKAG